MAEFMIEFTRDEVERLIPYRIVCETRESSVWDTMRRRRNWIAWFSDSEREACKRLFSQAHTWYLVKEVPDDVTMSSKTFDLWQKLGEFCACVSIL